MSERTLFVVGPCRVLGGAGGAVKHLTKRQLGAAKVMLRLGLSRDEWDDLEEQLVKEENWRQQMRSSRAARVVDASQNANGAVKTWKNL
jgi:hypothetical protein